MYNHSTGLRTPSQNVLLDCFSSPLFLLLGMLLYSEGCYRQNQGLLLYKLGAIHCVWLTILVCLSFFPSCFLRIKLKRYNKSVVLFQIVQIGRILNAHMGSLQWIDQMTVNIQNQLETVTKLHDTHRRENDRSFRITYE